MVTEIKDKRIKYSKTSKKAIDMVWDNYRDELYAMQDGTIVHTMYTEELKNSNKLRTYDRDGGWEYVEQPFEDGYVAEIKDQKETHAERKTTSEIYMTYTKKDSNIRIVDTRKGAKGTVCMTLNRDVLWDAAYEINYLPDVDISRFKDYSVEDLITRIRSNSAWNNLLYTKLIEKAVENEAKDMTEITNKGVKKLASAFLTKYITQDITEMSTKKLRKLLEQYLSRLVILLVSTRKQLCEWLHQGFKDKDLYQVI